MIVVDTNVISELMRRAPSERVRAWFDKQPTMELYLTSITQAEILVGIEMLPKGKRRDSLKSMADVLFEKRFRDRLLTFGGLAAREYAAIVVARQKSGRPISVLDAQIAAVARSTGAPVATRNIEDFKDCGVELIDPWR